MSSRRNSGGSSEEPTPMALPSTAWSTLTYGKSPTSASVVKPAVTNVSSHRYSSTKATCSTREFNSTALPPKEPMPLAQARAWWAERCLCSINTNMVCTLRNWSDFTFPVGQQLQGIVVSGHEMQTLKAHFGAKYPDGVPKYRISETSVHQQCPCGKVSCDTHVFPSTIEVQASFPIVLKLRKKTIQFGKKFRRLDPMTKEEAKTWFENIPLKWKVTVGEKIHLQMICKCGQPHDHVPCKVKMRNCIVCHAEFQRADMRGKMCQDCHHKEIIDCHYCSRRVPRGHYDCTPLNDSHYQQEVTGIYPPFMRRKMGKKGICLDCGEVMSYNIYARHQYRRHHGVKPGNGYSQGLQNTQVHLLQCHEIRHRTIAQPREKSCTYSPAPMQAQLWRSFCHARCRSCSLQEGTRRQRLDLGQHEGQTSWKYIRKG